jgi:hypothetical protein
VLTSSASAFGTATAATSTAAMTAAWRRELPSPRILKVIYPDRERLIRKMRIQIFRKCIAATTIEPWRPYRPCRETTSGGA